MNPNDVVKAKDSLANGPSPLGVVQGLFGGGPIGIATVSALMVRRVVDVDIRGGLHEGAAVKLAAE